MSIANNINNNDLNVSNHTDGSGLSQAEVLQLRQKYGENRLPAEKGTTVWTILLNQIKSPLVYIIGRCSSFLYRKGV
jgi:magnesium-transporting ATPase (P-type)